MADSLGSPQASQSEVGPGYIVGIGASAGGLEAFSMFFRHMPSDTGMAFVLVQHLDPHQPSLLPEILASQTPMTVQAVSNEMPVWSNHVYIIAPNTTLTIHRGVLTLAPPLQAHGHRMPIDHFFQSLATEQGARAIGIVLSGIGTDGTLGLAAIQDVGGLTLAQAPNEAQHEAMPRSAIDHRVVDHVLSVSEMPALLCAHIEQSEVSGPQLAPPALAQEHSQGLQMIYTALRRATGYDFYQYKQTTLLRRIARRMQQAQITNLGSYAEWVSRDVSEAIQLFQDLLISVTSFFRDPGAFDALSNIVIPTLLQGRSADTPLRIWTAACATGQEAYSVAMLILEQLEQMPAPPPVQLFATDIDEAALAVARRGWYTSEIETQVSSERLARFFVPDAGGYLVSKRLRELCIFSMHNLISDPPFARMDLILCRNLLIYFTPGLQQQLIPLLHYALVPGGYLLLGAAESVTAYPELFQTIDRPLRVFQRSAAPTRSTMPFPLSAAGLRPNQSTAAVRRATSVSAADLGVILERLMLQEYVFPAVVIDEQELVVYSFGRTGTYLELPRGAALLNIRSMIHPDLREALQLVLHTAWQDRTVIRSEATLKGDGDLRRVALIAHPLSKLGPVSGLTLIVFQELGLVSAPEAADAYGALPTDASLAVQLADELRATKFVLETTIADLQEANVELTTANEELRSINEELQVANEELQTSKEEIQSINEELQTVNVELNRKIEELDRVNADLANFFASTQIPAIFLHANGRIARFTPAATEVFRLIWTDIGRPITDIVARFPCSDLLKLVATVLGTLTPYEEIICRAEVQDWWIMRIQPYRTLTGVIDGVVITFTDITSLKQVEADREALLYEMRAARIYAEQIVATVVAPLLILDGELRVQSANPAYHQQFPATLPEGEQPLFWDLGGGLWNDPGLRSALEALRDQRVVVLDIVVALMHPPLGSRTLRLQGRRIEPTAGRPLLILLAIADITELARAASEMEAARDALESRVAERTQELAALNAALRAEAAEHRRSEQAREHLFQQLISAQEEERRRIARELHDQLGQALIGLLLGLKTLQDELPGDALSTQQQVRQLQELAMQIGQEVRTLAVQLRPAVLDDLGLVVALENYIEQWSARAAVLIDLHTDGLDGARLPLAVESTLYRIVQEALTNVLKHAQATNVSLIIERGPQAVRLIVEDNGRGFDIAAARVETPATQRLGLIGMDERITQLGGTLTIESAAGSGTTLFVTLPLAVETTGATDDDSPDLSG
ncbi:MAG TPA: chemotaxis protein CheB [Roseiflexaceae bacterium]|nr:chemotaxis protein CheB [Roseiflexaceae bacterium]